MDLTCSPATAATPATEAPAAQAAPQSWPPLRSDLQFHRVQEDRAHATWMLYDPLRGQYLELGELEMLVLQLWHLGSPDKVARALARDQGCAVTPAQVETVMRFALDNELLQSDSAQLQQKQDAISPQQRRLQQLQQHIFWRRPLFTPDLSSRLLLPLAHCTRAPWFYAVLASIIGFCAISVGQHWPEFLAYFDASWNAAGAATFFSCYLLLSLFHELGHASVARLYGIRANSVGVGLIALMPIMFSEITDAWRLPRRARLHISAGGVLFEVTLGAAAAVAWCLLDDGPLRALAFYLFTASLVATLLINANPLMKFDGYYLLSDITREKNLHQTASSQLRQWIWTHLLRQRSAPINRRQRLLVLFGFASLLYRLSVFALISYAAYQLLFKAAGVLMLVVCVSLLLLLPMVREVRAFLSFLQERKRQQAMQQNTAGDGIRSSWQLLNPRVLVSFALLLGLLLIPLPWPLQLPASTYFAVQQKVVSPAGAVVEEFHVQPGTTVRPGMVLATLHNSELEYRIARTREELKLLNRRQQSDGFAASLDALDGIYLQDLLSKRQLLNTLETEQRQLQVIAQVPGNVDWMLPGLHPGQYLEVNQLFLAIAARDSLRGRAYASPQQFSRFSGPREQTAVSGRLFVGGQWQPVRVSVDNWEQIPSRRVQDPALASVYGGPLQVLPDDHKRSAEPLYLLNFSLQADASHALNGAQRTGYLVLFGEPVSLLRLFTDRIAGVLIRESGV